MSIYVNQAIRSSNIVYIMANRQLIRKAETNSRQIKSLSEISDFAVGSVQDIAGLNVGVMVEDDEMNINIRGGRSSESGVIIDGVVQASSFAWNASAYPTKLKKQRRLRTNFSETAFLNLI